MDRVMKGTKNTICKSPDWRHSQFPFRMACVVRTWRVTVGAPRKDPYGTPYQPVLYRIWAPCRALRIPRQSCRSFHTKVATDSTAKLPPPEGAECDAGHNPSVS